MKTSGKPFKLMDITNRQTTAEVIEFNWQGKFQSSTETNSPRESRWKDVWLLYESIPYCFAAECCVVCYEWNVDKRLSNICWQNDDRFRGLYLAGWAAKIFSYRLINIHLSPKVMADCFQTQKLTWCPYPICTIFGGRIKCMQVFTFCAKYIDVLHWPVLHRGS